VHARNARTAIAVDPRRSDQRRIAAAVLSAILPGLGQAFNGRRRAALVFGVPSVILILAAWLVFANNSSTMLLARAIAPSTLQALLILNVLILVWRILAVVDAYATGDSFAQSGRAERIDRPSARRSRRVRPSRGSVLALAAVLLLVALPHLLAWSWGVAASSAFGRIFAPGVHDGPTTPAELPALNERINVLILGVDKTPKRTAALTDSMMVVSIDPVGHTISMVSLPRDLVNVPLGDGNTFAPKLNSLVSYAERHKAAFPDGGVAALKRAIGALLGVEIQYHARIDIVGFVKLVDAVDGVDVVVKDALNDPRYDGYGLGHRGYKIEPGSYHMNGSEALAYVRSRQGVGDSDFKRADRQQQVLIALRARATEAGSLLFRLPALFDALGNLVETDVPVEALPDLAAAVDAVGPGDITRMVVRHPLVAGTRNRYGSVQVPDIAAIRRVVAGLLGPPGVPPVPWPTPRPSASPTP
jgi:LCP family protein required for cell wall assembly